ncbi:MAG: hypothetical protein M1814_004688 [Vezdaea aestivalis]|nr:MAG: hypothetical protein M1814_004688 [Vezdaea aestivalis]
MPKRSRAQVEVEQVQPLQNEEQGDDPEYQHSEQDEVDEEDWGAQGKKGFIPMQRLPDSSLHDRSCEELSTLMQSGYLNLDPEYQRDIVWTDLAKSGLINSILEGFTVPILLFSVEKVKKPNGQYVYVRHCVDGKQRLTSIAMFLNGWIPCTDERGWNWFCTSSSRDLELTQLTLPSDCHKMSESGEVLLERRRLISEAWKNKFRTTTIPCREYFNLSMDQQRELFARVQKGIVLSPAEKLAATDGPYQALAKQMVRKYTDVTRLTTFTRSLDFHHVFNFIAQLKEIDKPSTITKTGIPVCRGNSAGLNTFARTNNKRDSNLETFSLRVDEVFQIWEKVRIEHPKIFTSEVLDQGQTRGLVFSASEWVATAILISQWGYNQSPGSRHPGLLASDIQELRLYLRRCKVELRNGNVIWQHTWRFITELESICGENRIPNIKSTGATSKGIKTKIQPATATETRPKSQAAAALKAAGVETPAQPPAFIQRQAAQTARARLKDYWKPTEEAEDDAAYDPDVEDEMPTKTVLSGSTRTKSNGNVDEDESREADIDLAARQMEASLRSNASRFVVNGGSNLSIAHAIPASTFTGNSRPRFQAPVAPIELAIPLPVVKPTIQTSPITNPSPITPTTLQRRGLLSLGADPSARKKFKVEL